VAIDLNIEHVLIAGILVLIVLLCVAMLNPAAIPVSEVYFSA
jgi:uncharacterized integral membrane protein